MAFGSRSSLTRGRFIIIARLESGGMGEAFRAWDSVAGMPVVLKKPLPVFAKRREVIERFDREVQRLIDLPHPRIVPVVQHGHDADGVPFLAMRFFPGGSLADRVKPQPPPRLHAWLPGIAEALDFIHAQGVLHRDIKPANIFFDAHGQAYLGDFGIAKTLQDHADALAEESVTLDGQNLGTFAYMAPEGFRQPKVLSAAYDQYALGITVYEMVCGRRPFSGDVSQLIEAHRALPPPDVRSWFADAPESLAEAVARSLAKFPEARFRTCREFAEAVLRGIPQESRDVGILRFKCPGCRRLVKVPQQAGGRQGRCTQCGVTLRVSADCDALWLQHEDPSSARTSKLLRPGTGLAVLVTLAALAAATWLMGRHLAVRSARLKQDWDAVLSMSPNDSVALVGRAVESLQKTPPEIDAAFSDLQHAKRIDTGRKDVQEVLARAHALRSRLKAASGEVEAAEQDLAVAEQMAAAAELVTEARGAIGAALLGVAKRAIAGGDVREALQAIARAEGHGVVEAEVVPLRIETLVMESEELERKGLRERAIKKVNDAISLDKRLAFSLLGQSTCDELRVASVAAFYRQQFEAAFDRGDWQEAMATVLTAESMSLRAWEWLDKAVANKPGSLATMPSTILEQLPNSTLAEVPASMLGQLASVTNSLGMTFRFIQAGSFVMGEEGQEASSPPHRVTLTTPFFLSSYEVTNAEWQRVMGKVPSRWDSDAHPVERVSWPDAVEFCRRLSAEPEEQRLGREYRLPTEAEWEYACRAGTATRYSFGDDGDAQLALVHGWYANNSGEQVLDPEPIRQLKGQDAYLVVMRKNECRTHPVGQKQSNPWGLYDMHGNVWEWCSDWYSVYAGADSVDPMGPLTGSTRVFRGGCWYFDIRYARSASRLGGKETFRRDDLGLRVAFTPVRRVDAVPP